ncbi:hypothetical protein APR04_001470 [Promicromonospora umidemergens]|uniref:DUF4352 domain-containing protein n=1 Tax=Promicromonospora umidemergens TaxID=629679 RepID=A0ABP8Y6K6_9MICO|nr:hypothetical protein [Promicromonospora umidemergens]MCP2282572.1 hypothetical protein [Promicromonospora umidemergens]
MPASPLITRHRLLLALVVLVLAAAAVAAVVALRSNAEPAAGAMPSASPTTSGEGAEDQAAGPEPDEPGQGGSEPSAPAPSDTDDAEPGPRVDTATAPEPRETLDPAPFDAVATPEPGVTVAVPSVEDVTGQANVPGEVGGPALRFAVELTNGTGKALDLRTVVVNAYYGPDRTPATSLLKPGGKPFEPEVAAGGSASGAFVFSVPAEFQDQVELEVDAGVGKAIVIFTGT